MKHVFTFILAACSLLTNAQLKISPGTQLVNNGNMVLNNLGIVNNGQLTTTVSSSSFKMIGGNSVSISGSGVSYFGSILLQKAQGASLLFEQDAAVSSAIVMGAGNIDLGNSHIHILGNLQNETENSRVMASGTGEIYTFYNLNNSFNYDPGGLGLRFTGTQNMGSVKIRRLHSAQLDASQQQSIQRYYIVEPQWNTNLNLSLRFNYFDAELGNLNESNLVLFTKQGNGSWTALGKDDANASSNYVQKNGINSVYMYTLFPAGNGSLPLQLIAFNVSCKDADASLQWITANEVNTKQFTIEKSLDGSSWQMAAVVPAKGNTLQQTYASLVAAGAYRFFRLKMEDVDGQFTYSPTRKIDCSGTEKFIVGPNPTAGKLVISATLNKANTLNVTVCDLSGKTVYQKIWQAAAGLNAQTIDLSRQPSGMYLVSVKGEGIQEIKKVVKE